MKEDDSPHTDEKDEKTVRWSLADKFNLSNLRRGRVRYFGIIDSSAAAALETYLDYIVDNYPRVKELKICMSSPGGDLFSALGFYDYLQGLRKAGKKITIVCEGISASAACMIVLQAADRRVARPNTRYLLHEIRSFKFGTERESEAHDEQRNLRSLSETICGILAKRCGKTNTQVLRKFRRRETWMSAKEALDWGLIDKIE